MVLSFDESSNELKYMRVQQKFVRTAQSIYHITYANGEELQTTWSHRFNIAGMGWVEAKDLRAGMKSPTAMSMSVFHAQLLHSGGMKLKIQPASFEGKKAMDEDDGIEIVVPENLPYMNEISGIYVEKRTDTVYNFSVEGGHTYFVSEDGEDWVWVHNDKYGLKSYSELSDIVKEVCAGADPSCYTTVRNQLRKQQAKDLYDAAKKNNPDNADTQFLQDLFETNIVSDAKDLKQKLNDILSANQGDSKKALSAIIPGFELAIDSGDAGFKKDFKDPHPSSSRQVGHFLTAVGLADNISDNAAIAAIISHEKVADDSGFWNRTKDLFSRVSSSVYGYFKGNDPQDVRSFKNAVEIVKKDNGDLKRGMSYLNAIVNVRPNQEGNSYEDLNLSLAGYYFGKSINDGSIKNNKEASEWIKNQLQK